MRKKQSLKRKLTVARSHTQIKHDNSPISVSVVVPVYNTERYLHQCLDSIINQSLKNIEIILVDDASEDSSLDICREYAKKDTRIHVFSCKKKGTAQARNYGITQAKGKYIIFLDSDDFFEQDMLELLYQRAEEFGTDIAFCDFSSFNDKTGKKILRREYDCNIGKTVSVEGVNKFMIPELQVFSAKDIPDNILAMLPNTVWCQLYRLDFILEEKILFQDITFSNDVFFSSAALLSAKKITFLDKSLVHYRRHPHSLTQNKEDDWKSPIEAALKLEEFIKQKGIYELYKKSFLMHAFGIISVGRRMREPVLSLWKNYLVQEVFPHLFKDENFYCLSDFQKKMMIDICEESKLSQKFDEFYKRRFGKIVPIAFTIKNEDVFYLPVAIQSIIEHASNDRFYDIYVFYSELKEKNIENLTRLSKNNVRVTCVNVKNNLLNPEHASILEKLMNENYYYPFFLPDLFYEYDKIVYLTLDVLCQRDIAELFDIDLGNNLLAGYNEKPNTKAEECINTSVLLVNLKLWRKEEITKTCWELFDKQTSDKLKEQNVLNIVCHNRSMALSMKWNCLLFKISDIEYKRELKKQGVDDVSKANIIHYDSMRKPWAYPDAVYSDIWWFVARKSPFYESVIFQQVRWKFSSFLRDQFQTPQFQSQIQVMLSQQQCQVQKQTQVINQNAVKDHVKPISSSTCSENSVKKQMLNRKEEFYPLVAEYVKECFLACFTFGSVSQKHKHRSDELVFLITDKLNKKQ